MANDKIDQRPACRSEKVTEPTNAHMLGRNVPAHGRHRGGEVLQHEDGPGAGVGQLVLELARLVQRIDIDHDAPRAQDPRHHDRVLQYVGQHDGDAISACQPARLEPARDGARQRIELLIRQVGAHAGEGDLASVASERILQQLRERADLAIVDRGGNASRIALQPEAVDAIHALSIITHRDDTCLDKSPSSRSRRSLRSAAIRLTSRKKAAMSGPVRRISDSNAGTWS